MTREELFWMGIITMVQNDPERIFYRIPELREILETVAIGKEEFNELLKGFRDKNKIQLYTGDVTCMTLEQARNRFTDENGFTFGTFRVVA